MRKSSAQFIYCSVEPRPKTDDGYFEQMAKTVFRSGFKWAVIESKWPDIQESFAHFSVKKVARFKDGDVNRLMKDKGIVRNLRKVTAIIENAKKIEKVAKEYGSFRSYLKATSKDGEQHLCKSIVKEFSYVGDSMVVSFLRSVGEEMPEMNEGWLRKHTGSP
ncbi:MAG: DNA-3-methyladenine glycosylase I [Patescibacteria group bacterium]